MLLIRWGQQLFLLLDRVRRIRPRDTGGSPVIASGAAGMEVSPGYGSDFRPQCPFHSPYLGERAAPLTLGRPCLQWLLDLFRKIAYIKTASREG